MGLHPPVHAKLSKFRVRSLAPNLSNMSFSMLRFGIVETAKAFLPRSTVVKIPIVALVICTSMRMNTKTPAGFHIPASFSRLMTLRRPSIPPKTTTSCSTRLGWNPAFSTQLRRLPTGWTRSFQKHGGGRKPFRGAATLEISPQ